MVQLRSLGVEPDTNNHVFWKRVRRGEDTADNVQQTLADLNTIPLEVYLSRPLMPLALKSVNSYQVDVGEN